MFKLYMEILKGYVKNRSRLEGCIVEWYIVEEAVEFCTDYLSNIGVTKGLPSSPHTGRITGYGITGATMLTVIRKELELAHLYVLNNKDEVEPYIEKHNDILASSHPNKSQIWLTKEHNQTFICWLKDHVQAKYCENPTLIPERLRWLANGPNFHVMSNTGYMMNGYTFYTK